MGRLHHQTLSAHSELVKLHDASVVLLPSISWYENPQIQNKMNPFVLNWRRAQKFEAEEILGVSMFLLYRLLSFSPRRENQATVAHQQYTIIDKRTRPQINLDISTISWFPFRSTSLPHRDVCDSFTFYVKRAVGEEKAANNL